MQALGCHPGDVDKSPPNSILFLSLTSPSLSLTNNSPNTHTHRHTGTHTHTHTPHTVNPTISSLTYTYQEASRTLTCVSTGSPPTVVEWMKNGQPLTIDGSLFSLSQTVTDRTASTYNNTLTVSERAPGGVAGTYTCTVSNSLGSATMTTVAVGEFPFFFLFFLSESSSAGLLQVSPSLVWRVPSPLASQPISVVVLT